MSKHVANPSFRPKAVAEVPELTVHPDGSGPTIAARDAVPGELLAVIAMFDGALAKVPFPDVDAALLHRQADDLRAGAKDVERARTALDAALAAVAMRTEVLAETATRGLAYARIYAEAHPARHALAEAVNSLPSLAMHPPSVAVARPRRGRKPRAHGELLFREVDAIDDAIPEDSASAVS